MALVARNLAPRLPCSTQMSMKSILLTKVKTPTIVGILTFISIMNTASEREKNIIFQHFRFYEQLNSSFMFS